MLSWDEYKKSFITSRPEFLYGVISSSRENGLVCKHIYKKGDFDPLYPLNIILYSVDHNDTFYRRTTAMIHTFKIGIMLKYQYLTYTVIVLKEAL